MTVQHHTKYIELHGVDEVVEMSRSEHELLHIRLRQEGKCNVPPDELAKISEAARRRGSKHKAYQKKYHAEHKEQITAYQKTYQRAYYAEHKEHLDARRRARHAAIT